MNYFSTIFFTLLMNQAYEIFDFNTKSDLNNWNIVDDVVMGGRSDGKFYLNEQGHGIFEGRVSLENNGGFSSLRYNFTKTPADNHQKFVIRLKGDRKRYQFRVKSNQSDRHSYIYHFETTGDWQTIEIPLSDMIPSFRGMQLNMPNYPGETMEEIAFLIGNKTAETFQLEIDRITLE